MLTNRLILKYILIFSGLLILLVLTSFWAMCSGDMSIPFLKIPSILMMGDSSMEYTILFSLRLPRILLGFAVGGGFGLAGVILQGIYRNPLVEPYTLGISGGAALSVALVIVLGLHISVGAFLLPFAGFVGALVTIFLVYFMSVKKGKIQVQSMVLIGVMISFIASSTMMFLMSITTAENLHGIIFWMMGSLDEPNKTLIYVALGISLLSLIISHLFIKPLNALRLGISNAHHLGINTDVAIKSLFVIASLLTGMSVAVAGIIGFVGLIVPHFMRLVVGTDFRILLISSFLSGGIFVIFADTVARTIILPNELPIGAITGMIGGIAFILLIGHQNRKNRRSAL